MQLEHGTTKYATLENDKLVVKEAKQYRWWSNNMKTCESPWFSSLEAAMLWANERGGVRNDR